MKRSKEEMEEWRKRLGTLDISTVYQPGEGWPRVPIGPGREYLQWLEVHW